MIFCACAAAVSAGEIRELELNDGSKLSGEVVSLSNGIYTVKSGSLGTVRIEESQVKSIRSRQESPGSAADAGALRERMIGNKEVMDLIRTLQDDPEFKAILEDPELMKAVNTGDLPALMANPRFMKLLNHTAVKDIQKKVE